MLNPQVAISCTFPVFPRACVEIGIKFNISMFSPTPVRPFLSIIHDYIYNDDSSVILLSSLFLSFCLIFSMSLIFLYLTFSHALVCSFVCRFLLVTNTKYKETRSATKLHVAFVMFTICFKYTLHKCACMRARSFTLFSFQIVFLGIYFYVY